MSSEGSLSRNYTFTASGDLSAFQYHFVKNPAGKYVSLATAANATENVGVLQNKPRNGEFASVGMTGQGKITAAVSFGANAWLTTTASGRAGLPVSGDMILARAMEAATADGDVVDCIYEVVSPARGRND